MSKKLLILTASILCLFVSGKTYPYKDYDHIVVPYQTGKIIISTPWGIYTQESYREDYTYSGYVLSRDRQSVYRMSKNIIPKWWVDKYVRSVNRCDLAFQLLESAGKLNSLNYDEKLSLMNYYLNGNTSDMYMLDGNYYMPILGANCN
jgi:hypothetical protein